MRAETVLLLEDDPDHTALFEAALEEARPHTRVRSVATVAACVDACKELRRFGRVVAFVDLKLTGETGHDAVRGIRGRRETSTVPVVMLSSSRQDSDIAMALSCGANAYMTKPFSYGDFVDQLRMASSFWFEGHRHPDGDTETLPGDNNPSSAGATLEEETGEE